MIKNIKEMKTKLMIKVGIFCWKKIRLSSYIEGTYNKING